MKFDPKAPNKHKKAIKVEEDLCIGCGVCVHKCRTESLTLVRKPEEEITFPPKTGRDLVTQNAMAAMEAKSLTNSQK